MIQLFEASTAYQIASVAALIDSGEVPDADRRVLVLANGSQVPELTTPLQEIAGFEKLAARFDAVVDLAALIWPRRPQAFSPREEELLMWQRLLRSHWDLGQEPVELFVESIQTNPAVALIRIFHDSPVSVHADGLMSYSPTRNTLRYSMAQRLDTLYYVDLVPGLRPLLLQEFGIQLQPADPSHLRAVLSELADEVEPSAPLRRLMREERDTSLVLGQYMVPLGILDQEEQNELDARMLLAAARSGAATVVYKPHPSAGAASVQFLRQEAQDLGLELVLALDDVPAEVIMTWLRPAVVVSGFSTSLFTADRIMGRPARAVGFDMLGDRLSPYENGNRVPLVLADAIHGETERVPEAELQGLVDSVGYCMQSKRLPELHDEAAAFLGSHPELRDRYVKQRRLRALGLPSAQRRAVSTGRTPRAVAKRVLQARLGEDGAKAAIARLSAARRQLGHTPRRAVGKLGSTLVSWSKTPQRAPRS